ncbi:5-formyltetrahydrofolate cyclo-ligase [Halobacteriales archaeon QH_7_69_31]|nr:MAG: 5-formyltetrahydrofolate cyclo-ligase [Halobacteriales archaeon QH_7_69_31]
MAKESIRQRVWDDLADSGEARFPFPPHDRIPNVAGAETAAERAMATPELRDADAVKANPDAPQLPLRRRLLRAGTTLYVAAPRLADEAPFLELDPEAVTDLEAAPTVSHMDDHGRRVGPGAVPPLDAIVVGSVAVTAEGVRVGKGEGFSDLEFAILGELGAADEDTPVVTTVHDRQVLEAGAVDPDAHDVPIDVICTPTRTLRVDEPGPKPSGIDWDRIDDERLDEIPVLARLRGD